jgi:hypothetical protein
MAIYTFEARVLVSGTVEATSELAAEELLNDELNVESFSDNIDFDWVDVRVDELEYDFDANEPDYDEDEDADLIDGYAVAPNQPALF